MKPVRYDDACLFFFALPRRRHDERGVPTQDRHRFRSRNVELVLEGDEGVGAQGGEVNGVFAFAVGGGGLADVVDEGGVRSNFFEDGEIVKANGVFCLRADRGRGVGEGKFTSHGAFDNFTGFKGGTDAFDDRGVQARRVYVGMADEGISNISSGCKRVAGADGLSITRCSIVGCEGSLWWLRGRIEA